MLRLELAEYSDDRMVLASVEQPKFIGYFFLVLAFTADLSATLLYILYSFSLIFTIVIFVASLLPILAGLSNLTSKRKMFLDRKSEILRDETKNIFRPKVRSIPFSKIEKVRVEPLVEEGGNSSPTSVRWTIGLELSDGDKLIVSDSSSKGRMHDLAENISKFLGKGEVERVSFFVAVADVDEVLPGERKLVQVGEDSIVLFNVGGRYYAIHNSCPHQGWPLIHSHLEGEVVTCSLHSWKFNLKDGCSPLSDHIKAKVYPTKVEESTVMIAV